MSFFKDFIKDSLSGDPISAYSNAAKNIKSAVENKMTVKEKSTSKPAELVGMQPTVESKIEVEYKDKLIQFAIINKRDLSRVKEKFEGAKLLTGLATFGVSMLLSSSSDEKMAKKLDKILKPEKLRELKSDELYSLIEQLIFGIEDFYSSTKKELFQELNKIKTDYENAIKDSVKAEKLEQQKEELEQQENIRKYKISTLSEEQQIKRYAAIEDVIRYEVAVHGLKHNETNKLRTELEALEYVALLGRAESVRNVNPEVKKSLITARVSKEAAKQKAEEAKYTAEAEAIRKSALTPQTVVIERTVSNRNDNYDNYDDYDDRSSNDWSSGSSSDWGSSSRSSFSKRKIVASRISKDNTIFPPSITIEENGLRVKFPSLFSGKEEFVPYSDISSISYDAPIVGFTKITLNMRGKTTTVDGFYKGDAQENKKCLGRK